jgi:polyisoprenoid-binding protein YceI
MRKFIGILLFCLFSFPLQAEKYILDNKHSYVLWHINHLGFSEQTGKWYINGFITLDPKEPQKAQVTANIDIAKIITGIPELDKHLMGQLFFDVAQFPTATFVSDTVQLKGRNTAKVQGQLSLHGVTKPITLFVKLNHMGRNPLNEKMGLGFSAKTQLKRSDFGMRTLIPNVGDEVDIDIGAEAYANPTPGPDNAPKKY